MHTNYRRLVTGRQEYPYTDAAWRREQRRVWKARARAQTVTILREWMEEAGSHE